VKRVKPIILLSSGSPAKCIRLMNQNT
jgi:hypothetical protein